MDLGAAPRDPHGEFSDIYRNLTNPLFPARPLWSDLEDLWFVGAAIMAIVFSLGVVPAIYAWMWASRRNAFPDVFQEGTFLEYPKRMARF